MTGLSVVIVSWNTKNLLGRCLDSLQKELEGLDSEVFVVDNASTDGSPSMVAEAYPWVSLIRNETNTGFASANNQVFALCKGEFVLLLNPDTRVLDGAIPILLSRLQLNPKVGAVAPKIVHEHDRLRVLSAGFQPSLRTAFNQYFMLSSIFTSRPAFRGINLIAGEHDDRIRPVEWMSAASMMVRRSIVGEVGGFSTRWFMYGEDMEWCHRIAEAGWILEHVPDAQVVHSLGASSEKNRLVSTMWVRNMRSWYVQKTEPSSLELAAFDGVLGIGLGVRAGYYLLRGLTSRQNSRIWFNEANKFVRAAAAPFDERKKVATQVDRAKKTCTKASSSSMSQLKELLRRTHTLQAADKTLFCFELLKNSRTNYVFRKQNPGFQIPPATLCFDAYGHVRADWYYSSGRETAEMIAGLINRYLDTASARPAILDWGCGSARVARHLKDFLVKEVDLWGSDYNSRAIHWSQNAIPWVRFSENNLAPPFGFESDSLDAVYGISVFTHLSEAMHLDWRDELLRVLKPGGILILTLNGDYWKDAHLLPQEKRSYDAGDLVVRSQVEEGKKWYSAYQSPSYVRNRFLAGTEILEYIRGPLFSHMKQEVWVTRKPFA